MLVAPFCAIGLRAFQTSDFTNEFFDPQILAVVKITSYQATISTFLSAAIGLFLGLWVGARRAHGSRIASVCKTLLALPYGVPTVVVAMAVIAWIGRNGILAQFGINL